jgi:hypothetical protein
MIIVSLTDYEWRITLGLGEELVFEIRPARTAAKFIIKSSLLLMLPNLFRQGDY